MNKVHKQIDLQENLKVVITRIRGFFSESDIASAIGAIGYAAKQHLRLRRDVEVSGTGTVMANVMILDLKIPLNETYSSNVMAHENEFNQEVANYLTNGVYHRAANETLGNFGQVNVGYVSSEPVRTVNIETSLTTEELEKLLATVGGKVL